jgi:hypothetical protein
MLLLAVFSLKLFTAVERIDVAICNPDGASKSVISDAKAETEAVFRPMGVQIVWLACEAFFTSVPGAGAPTFLIRLWEDQRPRAVGPASLDVMGESSLEGRHGGTTADIYLHAIRATAENNNADPSVVLGFVLAHELGHLLLGPGHSASGVMQAVWGQKEIDAARQRHLWFTKQGAERIRFVLEGRTAANSPAIAARQQSERVRGQ